MPWRIRFSCCRDGGEEVVTRNGPAEPNAIVRNNHAVADRVSSRAESVEKRARKRRGPSNPDRSSVGDGKPKNFDDLLKANELEMEKTRNLRKQRRNGTKDGPPPISMQNLPWPSVLESVKKCAEASGVDLDKSFRTPKDVNSLKSSETQPRTLQEIREKLKKNRQKSCYTAIASQTTSNALLERKSVMAVRPKVRRHVDVNGENCKEEDMLDCDSESVNIKTMKSVADKSRLKDESKKAKKALSFNDETAKRDGQERLLKSSKGRKNAADNYAHDSTHEEKISKKKRSKKVSFDNVIVEQEPPQDNDVEVAMSPQNSPTPNEKQKRNKKQTIKDVEEETPGRKEDVDISIPVGNAASSKEKRKRQRVKEKERGVHDEMPEPKYERKVIDGAEPDVANVVLKADQSPKAPAPPCEKKNNSLKFTHRGRLLGKNKGEDFQQEFTSLLNDTPQPGTKEADELKENLLDKDCVNKESPKILLGDLKELQANTRNNSVAAKASAVNVVVDTSNLKIDFCDHQKVLVSNGTESVERTAKTQHGKVTGKSLISGEVTKLDRSAEQAASTEPDEMSEITLQFKKEEKECVVKDENKTEQKRGKPDTAVKSDLDLKKEEECVVKDEDKTEQKRGKPDTAVKSDLDHITKVSVGNDDTGKVDYAFAQPTVAQKAVVIDEAANSLNENAAKEASGEEISAHKQSGKDNDDEVKLAFPQSVAEISAHKQSGKDNDDEVKLAFPQSVADEIVLENSMTKDKDADFLLQRALEEGLGNVGIGRVSGGVVEEIQANTVTHDISKSEYRNEPVDSFKATAGVKNVTDEANEPKESEKSVDEMMNEFKEYMFTSAKRASQQNQQKVVKMPQSVSNVKLSPVFDEGTQREEHEEFSTMNKEETLMDTLESEIVSAGRQALETHSRLSKDCAKHLIGEKCEIPIPRLRRLPPIRAISSVNERKSNDRFLQMGPHSKPFIAEKKMNEIHFAGLTENKEENLSDLQSDKCDAKIESRGCTSPSREDRSDSIRKMIEILRQDKEIMGRDEVKDDNGLATEGNRDQHSSQLNDGSRELTSANSMSSKISQNKLGKADNGSPINRDDTRKFQEKETILDSSSLCSGVISCSRTSIISNSAKSSSEDEGVQRKAQTKRMEFEALSNKLIDSLNQKTDDGPEKSDLDIEREKLAKAAVIANCGFVKPLGFSRKMLYAPEEVDSFVTCPSTFSHDPMPIKKLKPVQFQLEQEVDSLFARKIKAAQEKAYNRLLNRKKGANSQTEKKRNAGEQHAPTQCVTGPEDVVPWNEYIEAQHREAEGYYCYQPYPEQPIPIPIPLGSGCMMDENVIFEPTPSTMLQVQRPVAASSSLLPRRAKKGEVQVCRVPQPYAVPVAGYMPCPPSTSHEPSPPEQTGHPGRQIAYPFYNPYNRF